MTRWGRAALVGIPAVMACLWAGARLAERETSFRHGELERDTRVVTRQFTSRIRGKLEQHRIALQQMANFWANSEEVTEQEFYNFASYTLNLTPHCRRISAVDPSFHVRWVYPAEANRTLRGYDVSIHPAAYEAALRAMREKETVFSHPLELIGGGKGFILAEPIFRNGGFLGEVVCDIRSDDFFSTMFLPEVFDRYEGMVLESDTPLFASASFVPDSNSLPMVHEEFSLGGNLWQVRVEPRGEMVRERLRSGMAAFWLLGGLLALAAGGLTASATYWGSALAARRRSPGTAPPETRAQLDSAAPQQLQAEKMKALGELVATVAHEINNPLSTVMGYTQLLLAKDLPPEVKRRLETVYAESERMGRIVKNLLLFARKRPPEKKYLGLNGIIEKTLESKAHAFQTAQIRVEKDLAADLPMTRLDFHQIQQVLLNLLSNAEQAIAAGRQGGTIRVTTRHRNGRIEARVSDTGPGVPPEIQSRIFEPFFTTKKERQGSGMGLSLCYGILEGHGGTIQVESTPGPGATFVIDLPVLPGEAAVAAEGPGPSPSPGEGLRILIVDDEPSMQNLLVELLGSRGHRVDTASDLGEALRKITGTGQDLIISDIDLPEGSGQTLYRAVVERNPRLARRIVFTSGDDAASETVRRVREEGNEVVLKPFKIEQMEQAITRAMQN